VRLLEYLIEAKARVYLVLYSQVAQVVARQEMNLTLPGRARECEEFFSERFRADEGQLRVFGRRMVCPSGFRDPTPLMPWSSALAALGL
jgi:4-hydroxy-3-polyprenylbenzoate decarboxylase